MMCLYPQQLHQLLQHELREKDLIIMDHNKLNTMLQRRCHSCLLFASLNMPPCI